MNKFGLCRLIETESNDPQELNRQIEQATRLASVTTDPDDLSAAQGICRRTEAEAATARSCATVETRNQSARPRILGTTRSAYGPGPRVLAAGRAGTQRGREQVSWRPSCVSRRAGPHNEEQSYVGEKRTVSQSE